MSLSLPEFLPYRLNRLAEAVSARIRPIYRDAHGLTRPEWRAMVALADLGAATATAICAHSSQHKTKVSRAVAGLEARRWLARRADPADRRAEILALTEAGRRAYRDLAPLMRAGEAALLAPLDPEERAALDRGLAALERALALRPGASRPE
jgi:DNA-binding MarR family transcriptional regulator